jgi:hypothetical protein
MLPDNAYRVEEVVSYDAPGADRLTSLDASEAIPATMTLKSGAKICDIHHIILCTGYHLTLPFLPHLHSDETPVDKADDTLLVTDGTQFHNLHKDIFYITQRLASSAFRSSLPRSRCSSSKPWSLQRFSQVR